MNRSSHVRSRLALSQGLLDFQQLCAVMRVRADTGKSFEEVAVQLGYLSEEEVQRLFEQEAAEEADHG